MAHPRTTVLLMAILLALGGTGCAKSDAGSDPAPARRQAVEKLRAYGLTSTQATCVVDRLGSDPVVEANDLDALAEGGPYQAAAKACVKKTGS